MAMKIYEIDTGATYYVVAENLQQALDTVFRCWEEEGSLEDAEGSELFVKPVSEEKARKVKIQMDDEAGSQRLLWDLLRDAEKPEVVACSEWP